MILYNQQDMAKHWVKHICMRTHIKGSGPEWCISSMIYSGDTPFWFGTLDMHMPHMRAHTHTHIYTQTQNMHTHSTAHTPTNMNTCTHSYIHIPHKFWVRKKRKQKRMPFSKNSVKVTWTSPPVLPLLLCFNTGNTGIKQIRLFLHSVDTCRWYYCSLSLSHTHRAFLLNIHTYIHR